MQASKKERDVSKVETITDTPYMFMGAMLFALLGVPGSGKFLVEFVNPARSVYELHFTREKRMGLAGNFQLHERILFTVLPHNGVIGGGTGTRQEGFITGEILEYHHSIFFRMRVFLHVLILWERPQR
jgi:hypothetical protein